MRPNYWLRKDALHYIKPIIVIFVIFSQGIVFGSQVEIPSVKINIQPGHQTVVKGQEFTIDISVDPEDNPITAMQFNLLFNSSLIDVKNVKEGDLFKQNQVNTILNPGILNNSGALINVWGLIITPGAYVIKEGTLATITMYAKETGSSPLNFTNMIISDPNSNMVQASITNGLVTVAPPSGISNLHNTTYNQFNITWKWTDPADSDFSRVQIYLNDKFKGNVSKGIRSYNATGLRPGTPYTIAIRTIDIAGNINPEWVNHTSVTAPDYVPAAGIINLQNITYAQFNITWKWTDPADPDFSRVMIYLNGKSRGNVSKGVQSYNATGLIPGTTYTIATRTIDIAGNINPEWVNHTSVTAPDYVPSAGITNLQNITYAQFNITWKWTDPADPDFSRVMIYLDGKFKGNVTKGVQSYNATGLKPGTTYTIATRTIDKAGNINQNWVNYTTITAPDLNYLHPSTKIWKIR